jgi:hypothetical protein
VRIERLPLTYDECRARFRRAATDAGVALRTHQLAVRGPQEQVLSIDAAWVGPARPERALVVLSGVHGVEGFLPSVLQSDLLARLEPSRWPAGTGVLLVHAVNPWGMAWWRRQNESNVDLNRNWRRDDVDPLHNDAYDELHPIACPDTEELPSVEDMLLEAATLVADRGLTWVRDGITRGQYRHPDGLHFGGDRTEESAHAVATLVPDVLGGVERVLVVDLHTGHGPYGEVTFLSDQPIGSPQDRFLREHFDGARVEATRDNPGATTGVKSGQIANGLGDVLPGATVHASSVEFGTAGDEEQLAVTYLESWVHRHGDASRPEHAEVRWRYRCAFTPDDPDWERTCTASGRALLTDAVDAVAGWR